MQTEPAASTVTSPSPASWLALATLCAQLAGTAKKLEKRALMAAYLQSLAIEDTARAALWLAGAPFAETDLRKLQVGGSTLSKAVAELSGAGASTMQAAYRRHGDLGDAAFDLLSTRPTQAEPTLTLSELEDAFTALALARGPSAKLALLLGLLGRATPLEARYLIKLAGGDMRIGVKQSLVEEAVAAAYGAHALAVRRAVMLNGNLAEVVGMAAAGTLAEARMRLFHPLGFMLASPVDSVGEALARFAQEIALEAMAGGVSESLEESPQLPPAAVAAAIAVSAPPRLRAAQLEDKYDGMRAQLHCGDASQPNRVGLFSRNREDIAESFPELIEAFAGFGEEVILDGEILAWQPGAPLLEDCGPTFEDSRDSSRHPSIEPCHPDRTGVLSERSFLAGVESEGSAVALASTTPHPPGRALPFSSLQQRLGRKRVTAEMRAATPVVFMAFDLLYQAGDLLLEHPLSERRARLVALVEAHSASARDGRPVSEAVSNQTTLFAPEPQPATPSLPRLLLAPALQLASAAQLDAAYTDARGRGNEGVMLKAAGSLYQPGRRGLAWLKLKRELATLDVVITGAEFGNGRRAGVLSDYTFAVRASSGSGELLNVGKAYSGLTDIEVDALSRRLHEQTLEDYGHFRTVEPTIVLEVAFNNVMRSDRHASGFALRFPRILHIRTDKPLDEIDTLGRVEEIYASQPDKPVEPPGE